jgi:hypothetical protein
MRTDRRSVERVLSTYTLHPGARDERVERLRFPPMIAEFRRLVALGYGMPPTQDVFAETVAHAVEGGSSYPFAALLGRGRRTYPSLVAQYHALLTLEEFRCTVVWDDRLDMHYDVDLIITTEERMTVGLSLLAPTPLSQEAMARKQGKSAVLPFPVRHVTVQRGEYSAGPFWLYPGYRLWEAVESAASEQAALVRTAMIGDVDDVVRGTRISGWAQPLAQRLYAERARRKCSRQDFTDGVVAGLTAALRGLWRRPAVDVPEQGGLFEDGQP